MTRFELSGLRPDLPISAMAAFGLLRVASLSAETFGETFLAWSDTAPAGNGVGGKCCAVLTVEAPLSKEQLITQLVERMRNAASRQEFTWSSSIDVEEFAKKFSCCSMDRELLEWAAAFTSDMLPKKRTTFDTTAGQQGLLSLAREAAVGLDPGHYSGRKGQKSPHAAFYEALFGPWRYEDDQHTLGWDPTSNRLGAFTRMAPTRMKNRGVRAGFWLAMESLPLFPCFVTSHIFGHRLETTGFDYGNSQREFRWPIWNEPLNLDELRSLVGQMRNTEGLRNWGVRQIYSSNRVEPNDRYGCFLPARLLTCGST